MVSWPVCMENSIVTQNLLKYMPKLTDKHKEILQQALFLSDHFKQNGPSLSSFWGQGYKKDNYHELALCSYERVVEAFSYQHRWKYFDRKSYTTVKELAKILDIEFTATLEKGKVSNDSFYQVLGLEN